MSNYVGKIERHVNIKCKFLAKTHLAVRAWAFRQPEKGTHKPPPKRLGGGGNQPESTIGVLMTDCFRMI